MIDISTVTARPCRSTRWRASAPLAPRPVVLMIWLLCLCPIGTAWALPAGRHWIPTDTTQVPGHTRLLPTRIDLDSLGCPMLYAAAVGGIGSDYTALSWRDSAWVQRWSLGYGITWMSLVDDPAGGHPLIWQASIPSTLSAAVDLIGGDWLVMSEDLGDTYATPDTIAKVDDTSFYYAGAVSSHWRWAVKADWQLGVRLFSSRDRGPWHEYRVDSTGTLNNSLFRSVAIQTLDDSSALVGWTKDGSYRLQWGVLSGDAWERKPATWFSAGGRATGLALSRGGGDGFWVGWATGEPYVVRSWLKDGEWAPPESLTCDYHMPGPWRSVLVQLSRDPFRYPVVSWLAWTGYDGSPFSLSLSVPTDSGDYPVAENLEDTYWIAQGAVIRDINEDVWVVWWNEWLEGMFWTHSAVRATAVDLRVERPAHEPRGHAPWGRRRLVRWELSEPAPGSYWTVQRAEWGGAFTSVARLRAGPEPAMSWEDPESMRGPARYRLRRESVDRRYEWLSGEVTWPPMAGRRFRALPVRVPIMGPLEFTVEGAAAGPLRLRVYDVQGRLVDRREVTASGQGHDEVRFGDGALSRPLSSGIYFLAMTDAAGAESETTRIVMLR
jgi:hypothetical protein